MNRGHVIAALAVALVSAGCSGQSSEHPESVALFCAEPSPSFIDEIEEGLTLSGGGSLRDAWYVHVQSDLQDAAGWPEWLLGGDVQGAGLEGDADIAVWATGADERPIVAVDEAALEFSDWDAATQSGSPAPEVVDELRSSSEYEDVFDCVAR